MAIPQSTADSILARCGRRCCVCRRFRPLLLQVHHIKERSDGGTDDDDNLIATCISCHANIHTQTQLTRRFTDRELKQHRDQLYQLISDGKLIDDANHDDRIDQLTLSVLGIARNEHSTSSDSMLPQAVEILLAASQGNSIINGINFDGGFAVMAGSTTFGGDHQNRRDMATYRKALEQLVRHRLIDGQNNHFSISHDGYEFLDNVTSNPAET